MLGGISRGDLSASPVDVEECSTWGYRFASGGVVPAVGTVALCRCVVVGSLSGLPCTT